MSIHQGLSTYVTHREQNRSTILGEKVGLGERRESENKSNRGPLRGVRESRKTERKECHGIDTAKGKACLVYILD